MYQIILLFHILLSVALVVLVLIQRGKGASMGAAFGAGASGTVFGSVGSASVLFKITAVLAATFFATSLTLGYIAATQNRAASEMLIPLSAQDAESEEPAIPLFELDESVDPNAGTDISTDDD